MIVVILNLHLTKLWDDIAFLYSCLSRSQRDRPIIGFIWVYTNRVFFLPTQNQENTYEAI